MDYLPDSLRKGSVEIWKIEQKCKSRVQIKIENVLIRLPQETGSYIFTITRDMQVIHFHYHRRYAGHIFSLSQETGHIFSLSQETGHIFWPS